MVEHTREPANTHMFGTPSRGLRSVSSAGLSVDTSALRARCSRSGDSRLFLRKGAASSAHHVHLPAGSRS